MALARLSFPKYESNNTCWHAQVVPELFLIEIDLSFRILCGISWRCSFPSASQSKFFNVSTVQWWHEHLFEHVILGSTKKLTVQVSQSCCKMIPSSTLIWPVILCANSGNRRCCQAGLVYTLCHRRIECNYLKFACNVTKSNENLMFHLCCVLSLKRIDCGRKQRQWIWREMDSNISKTVSWNKVI